jgi:hypothetical protein
MRNKNSMKAHEQKRAEGSDLTEVEPENVGHRGVSFFRPSIPRFPVDLSTYRNKERTLIIGPHGMFVLSPWMWECPTDLSTYKQTEGLLGVVGLV